LFKYIIQEVLGENPALMITEISDRATIPAKIPKKAYNVITVRSPRVGVAFILTLINVKIINLMATFDILAKDHR